jgi:hypothetical protein
MAGKIKDMSCKRIGKLQVVSFQFIKTNVHIGYASVTVAGRR